MRIVQEIERQKWSDFVYLHPHGNIFQTPEMYEAYKNTKNYEPVFLAAIDEQDEILGILLAVIQREGRGVLGSLSARSINWGGPVVKNNDPEVLKSILNEYDGIIKEMVLYSQFRNLWDLENNKEVFLRSGYIYKEHLNIRIDLSNPEDALWKELSSMRRSNIRKAQRKGIIVKELKDQIGLDKIYNILKQVYQDAKLPIADKSLFTAASQILGRKGMVKYFCAFDNSQIIGVRCILAYKHNLYDWYGGSFKKYLNKHPNDLLPWEFFMWGKRNGFTTFDWGGAGRPDKEYGVRDYKKQFGGEMVNYGRFQKVYKPIKFKLADLGLKIWQKVT